MIKLIASDMDGTLVKSDGTLDGEIFPLIEQLTARDIICAAATGRLLLNIEELFAPVAERLLYITQNGAHVSYQKQTLASCGLSAELVLSCLDEAASIPDFYPIVFDESYGYVQHEDERFQRMLEKFNIIHRKVPDLRALAETHPLLRFTGCDFRDTEQNGWKRLQACLGARAQVTFSSAMWLDVVAKGVSKGAAMQSIQQRLQIAPEEVMAFGDFYNDLELIGAVGHSVAMANACEAVKKAARYETRSNDQGGVVWAIQHYLREGSLCSLRRV